MIKLLCLWAIVTAVAIAQPNSGYALLSDEPIVTNGNSGAIEGFNQQSQNPLPPELRAFGKIREINQMQMQFSQIVLQRSSNQAVRQFARQVYAQYSYSDRELTQLSRMMNIPMVNFPMSEDEWKGAAGQFDKLIQLSILSGRQLDTQFVTTQIDYHRSSLSSMESFIGATNNEYAKRYFTKTKDSMTKYYEAAQKLQAGFK